MKSICIIALALVAVCTADTYTAENDDLDIKAVVDNPKTLKEFVDCFTDRSECSTLTAAFKKDMPEAVQQACAKCTPAQKHIFRFFLEGLKKNMPDDYEVYRQKFDPDNKLFTPLLAAVANY